MAVLVYHVRSSDYSSVMVQRQVTSAQCGVSYLYCVGLDSRCDQVEVVCGGVWWTERWNSIGMAATIILWLGCYDYTVVDLCGVLFKSVCFGLIWVLFSRMFCSVRMFPNSCCVPVEVYWPFVVVSLVFVFGFEILDPGLRSISFRRLAAFSFP